MLQFFKAILYQPLFNLLVFFVWLFPGHSVGWAIIILTIIIRVILLPVTVHTARVQVRMRLLQPKIDELRKKHKDDKALQSQALMALYKEEGVSPFSSCLPLIVQLVVLIVLYNVFRNGLNTTHFDALYSFMPRPSSVNTVFLGINLAKPELWVLPALAAITQLWQTKVTFVPSGNSDDPAAAMSKQMLYIAPIITFVFARTLPAALPLYWILTSLFTVAQQEYVIKRQGLMPQSLPAPVKKAVEADKKEAAKTEVERKRGGVTVTVKRKK